jgi:DNA-binding GntR family transcriptional regulator
MKEKHMANVYPLQKPVRRDADSAQDQILGALSAASLDPKLSYSDQVHGLLREAILHGKLLPGVSLSEAGLANAVGISRQPVREAIRMLAQEGLVMVYPQVGTIVAPIRVSLIAEGHFVRSALENANLLELVKVITPAQITAIKQGLKQQRSALKSGDTDEFFRLDEAMHRKMFELTGRERIWDLIESSKIHLDRVRWLLLEHIEAHAERAFKEHEVIVEKLANKDAEGITQAIHQHIDSVAEHLLDLKKKAPTHYFSD